MLFTHTDKVNKENLNLIEEYNHLGRFYCIDEKKGKSYPSVTTVLSKYDKEGLKAWRKRVGEEEANRITTRAGNRGTALHDIAEKYLNNDPDYEKGQMPINLETFEQIRPMLEQNVSEIHAQEMALYSDFLKVAGRVDCVAKWGKKLAIIDFKTSLREKREEWVKGYFMQASAYAVMFEERTGIPVSRIVIPIMVDDGEPQLFVERRDDHIEDFIRERVRFNKLTGA